MSIWKKSFKTQCAHSTRGKTLKKKKEAGRDELSILIESFDSSIKTNLLRPPNITEAYIFARFHSFEYMQTLLVCIQYISLLPQGLCTMYLHMKKSAMIVENSACCLVKKRQIKSY